MLPAVPSLWSPRPLDPEGRRRKLNYKVARLGSPPKAGSLDGGTDSSGRLVTVPAAYTSQTCHQCGHVAAENRKSQASFACVRCGHEADADHNAASNILAKNGFSGSGIGAAGRGSERKRKSALEALALATLVSRQKVSAVAGVPPLGVGSALWMPPNFSGLTGLDLRNCFEEQLVVPPLSYTLLDL